VVVLPFDEIPEAYVVIAALRFIKDEDNVDVAGDVNLNPRIARLLTFGSESKSPMIILRPAREINDTVSARFEVVSEESRQRGLAR